MSIPHCRYCVGVLFHEGSGCACLLCGREAAACPPDDARHPIPRRVDLEMIDVVAEARQLRRINGYKRTRNKALSAARMGEGE